MNWIEDDLASHGEQVARCIQPSCRAPMRFVLGPTLIVIRCETGHIAGLHLVFPEEFCAA